MVPEAKIDETQSWLRKAFQDLQSAQWLLSSPDALYNVVTFRYPGNLPELSFQDAELAYTLAQQIWKAIIMKLPPELHIK